MKWQKRFPIKRVSLSENVFRNVLTFNQWNGKTDFPLKRVILSENVCPISINLSENVVKRLANQHQLGKTLSIG